METLEFGSRHYESGSGITAESATLIDRNIKYLKNLKNIYLGGKNANEIGNEIRDYGCVEIFKNAKNLPNLEILHIHSNRENEK